MTTLTSLIMQPKLGYSVKSGTYIVEVTPSRLFTWKTMQTRAIRRSDRFNYQLPGMRFLLLDISAITTLNARTAHGELVVIQSSIGGKLWFILRRKSHLKKS